MTTVIDGTTGIDKVKDGSIVQTDLAPNVAGNGPAFSAYQSVAQAMAASTLTKIQFQTKEFDPANSFDNTTNSRFQPAVAGYYQVIGIAAVGATACTIYGSLFKTGIEFKRGLNINVNGGSCLANALIYLNGTTDYVEFWAYFSTAQNTGAGIFATYFQGFLARAA